VKGESHSSESPNRVRGTRKKRGGIKMGAVILSEEIRIFPLLSATISLTETDIVGGERNNRGLVVAIGGAVRKGNVHAHTHEK